MSHQVQDRSPSASVDNSPHMLTMMTMLIRARDLAHQLARDPWDFAEEISGFWAAGITNGEIRNLLLQGLVIHAEETSSPNSEIRTFRKIRNLSMSQRTCFVLTEKGEAHVRNLAEPANGHQLTENGSSQRRGLVPEWHTDVRELRVGKVLVKAFHRPAPRQETVLAAFQEQHWAKRIDDPLPRLSDRDAKLCLHDTINHLNRNLLEPLLHFFGDGTGRGVRWQFRGDDLART
jgi:hypothetical protein